MLRNATGHGRGGGVMLVAETKLGIDLFSLYCFATQGERLDENSGSLKREEGGKNNFMKEEPYHYSIRVLIRLFEV